MPKYSLRSWQLGFEGPGVLGLRFRGFWGVGFRVWGFGFRVVLVFGVWVWGLGLGVWEAARIETLKRPSFDPPLPQKPRANPHVGTSLIMVPFGVTIVRRPLTCGCPQ